MLCDFEEISGLRINFRKSILGGVGVADGDLQLFAQTLGCQIHSLPVIYLGLPLPLEANPNRKSTWKPVTDRFKAKLASWKRRYVSFGGRIVLIKSVLCNLPIFFMSLFKIPEGVARIIEGIQANFLWAGSNLKRRLHLVTWSKLTQGRGSGGLGIRNIREVNDTLLMKWWWRYGMEKNALWRKVNCQGKIQNEWQ